MPYFHRSYSFAAHKGRGSRTGSCLEAEAKREFTVTSREYPRSHTNDIPFLSLFSLRRADAALEVAQCRRTLDPYLLAGSDLEM